jgi:phosphoribosyl 1,2-cyclic phosphate phosphodiesterase
MPIYAHKRVIESLKKRFDYIFEEEDRYPGAPSVTIHEVDENQNFTLAAKTVVPILVKHGNLDIFGYRIDDFAYMTDVKFVSDAETEKLRGTKVLVISALREQPHETHFNLQEALDFIAKVQPDRAYLTHISHLMGFHAEVQEKLPKNVFLAYDNLQITV